MSPAITLPTRVTSTSMTQLPALLLASPWLPAQPVQHTPHNSTVKQ
jgi:hypothetical protein